MKIKREDFHFGLLWSSLFVSLIGFVRNETNSDFPYLVSIQHKRKHICTGVLMEYDKVLTTGHCIKGYKPKELSVQPNYDGMVHHKNESHRVLGVKSVIIHEESEKFKNDIGILILTEDAPKNGSGIHPISISADETLKGRKRTFKMAAWGYTRSGKFSDKLVSEEMYIQDPGKCSHLYSGDFNDGMICGSSRDQGKSQICRGDSGAPLVLKYRSSRDLLIGLASISAVECTSHPMVFVDVPHHLSWIESKLEDN